MRKRQKRPWVWIIGVIISIALFVIQQLLVPKPDVESAKAAGLGDFNFPTSLENRSLPLIYGSCRIRAPNVIWYGALRIRELTDRIPNGGLFSGKKTIVIGHVYYVGFDLAISLGPIDTISHILVGNKVLLTDGDGLPEGGITDNGLAEGIIVNVDKPGFWGGREQGGGMQGNMVFYDGNDTATPNEYVIAKVTNESPENNDFVPGYNGMCHMVWAGGNIGESASISKWEFQVHRYPNSLGVDEPMHKINPAEDTGYADANPVCCLFELLTDTDYGLGLNPGDINQPTFLAAAETVYNEGNGYSYVIDKALGAQKIVEEILKQIEASLYQNTDGKFTLKLVRDDFDVETIELFDTSNIVKIKNLAKQGWTETTNSVHVEYFDRENEFKKTFALAQDMGNMQIQGQQEVAKFNYPGVRVPAQAARIAARELRDLATPLIRLSFTANRQAADLYPGDVVKVNYPEYGLDNMVLRISEVGLGDLKNGDVTIKGYQEIFGEVPVVTFTGGGYNLHDNVDMEAITATDILVQGVPAWIARVHGDDQVSGLFYGRRAMHLVAAPDTANKSFMASIKLDAGGSNFTYSKTVEKTPTTEMAVTTAMSAELLTRESDTYLPSATFTFAAVSNSAALTEQTLDQIKNQGQGLIQIGDEIMGYTSLVTETLPVRADSSSYGDVNDALTQYSTHVTGISGIYRGLLDTDLTDHIVGEKIWFISAQTPALDQWDVDRPGVVTGGIYKHQTITPRSKLELADAVDVQISDAGTFGVYDREAHMLRPCDLNINGNYGASGHNIDVGEGQVELNFKNQNSSWVFKDPEIYPQDESTNSSTIGSNGFVKFHWYIETVAGGGAAFPSTVGWTKVDAATNAALVNKPVDVPAVVNPADPDGLGYNFATGVATGVDCGSPGNVLSVGGELDFTETEVSNAARLTRAEILLATGWTGPAAQSFKGRVVVQRWADEDRAGNNNTAVVAVDSDRDGFIDYWAEGPSIISPYREFFVDGD